MGRNEESLWKSHKSWKYFLTGVWSRAMIFVTVGTHEQQFNRLVQYIDKLKGDNIIEDEVIMQTGFSTYKPQYCDWHKILPYHEMIKKIENARIVVTHGGPSSFILPLQMGKVPVVVPRQKQFGEHINNHQVDFVRKISKSQSTIIVVENISELGYILSKYEELVLEKSIGMNSNNEKFNLEFERLIENMFR